VIAASLATLLLLAAADGGGEPRRAPVEVTMVEGGAARDPVDPESVARALADVGELVVAGGSRQSCDQRCVRVAVRSLGDDRYLIETRGRARVLRSSLQLSPAASRFDRAHALAIEIELLVTRARDARASATRRPSGTKVAAALDDRRTATVAAAPPAPADPATDGDASTAAVEPEGDELPAERAPAPPPPPAPAIAVAASVAASPAPVREHLALSVAATVLTGLSSGMFQRGFALGIRVPFNQWLDVRAGGSLLRPEGRTVDGVKLHRELLPLDVLATVALPGIPGTRSAVGLDAHFITGEKAGVDAPEAWSLGISGGLEYRRTVRSLVLTSSVLGYYHPTAWRTRGPDDPLFATPVWSLGVSLGLELKVF
jgi:hypothetical protein